MSYDINLIRNVKFDYFFMCLSPGWTPKEFWPLFDTLSFTIKEIIIPDTVKSVYRCAFYALSNLTTIDWGKGVSSIGDYAVASTNVSEIYLPNSSS